MINKVYRTELGGNIDTSLMKKFVFHKDLVSKQESIDQARIIESNFPVCCKIYECKLDGEDIVESKLVYDGTDE